MIEIRTVKITWYVETGYCNIDGTQRTFTVKESIPLATEASAYDLRDEWLSSGKLQKMPWGEIRPTFEYGLFRIRRSEEVLNVHN